MKNLQVAVFIGMVILAIACHTNEYKVDTSENLTKELRGVENEKITPHADPEEFENEVNNGGLNQYFFNSSGQNCFATLKYFKKNGMTKEAKILEEAISLINPKKLPEDVLIENLRKRIVTELEDSTINLKLDKLSSEFYK